MMNRIDIRQLEAFAAVMSTGSVTGAARLLGRSQPAVTRAILDLEAATGYPLFIRHGPRVAPTQEGFAFHEEVGHLLGSWQRLLTRTAEIGRGDSDEPMRLSTTSAVAVGLLPQALARLEAAVGPAPVQVVSVSPERVLHAVLGGGAQLGATSLPLEHQGLQPHWIGEAPCVAALADGDPLLAAKGRRTLRLASLAGRRLITLANPYRLRRRIERALDRERGGPADGLIETSSSVNALALARAGLGIALLDPLTAHGMALPGIQYRRLDVDVPYYFGVVTPQDRPLARRLQALSDALLEAARALPGFVLHPAGAHAGLLRAAATA